MPLAQKLSSVFKAAMCTLMLSSLTFELEAQQSAQSELSLTRGEAVWLRYVDEWFVGIYDTDETIGTLQYDWDAQCVHSTTGTYQVAVSSANGGAELALVNDNGDQMAYRLFTFSRVGAQYFMNGYDNPMFTLTGRSGSRTFDCSDEPSNTNLWFTPVVSPGPFNAAPPGIYRDTITLLVSPE